MNEKVDLYTPKLEELWYREQMMLDPDTMSYNKGYEEFEGYDKETGCIAFPPNRWNAWYDYFIGNEPQRFYAYIVRIEDGKFIGEVNLHKSKENDWYEMGIVLEARYRGLWYSIEALKLLLKHAFITMNASAVHNKFEIERKAAIQTHLSAGFTEYEKDNNMIELIITREQYFKHKI